MAKTIRFHLDEHVDSAVAEGLRRRGIDVSTTAERNLIGADDELHWQLVTSEQRVHVTSDSDFLNFHEQGRPHWGIAYCHQQSRTIGQLIHALELIWEVLEPTDMQNRVEFL